MIKGVLLTLWLVVFVVLSVGGKMWNIVSDVSDVFNSINVLCACLNTNAIL